MRLNFAPSLGIFDSSYFIFNQYIIYNIMLAYHFFRCTIFSARNVVLSIIISSQLSLVLNFSLHRIIFFNHHFLVLELSEGGEL